ncbi:hypothetical protein N9764_07785 [Polaribacter sp.]|nr:hypothetical protein [Polaribacter sp.]
MKKNIYILLIFVYIQANSQNKTERYVKELSLIKVYSNNYFFNTIIYNDNIYLGTNKGIFTIKENKLKEINTKKGYVFYNSKSKKLDTKNFKEGLLNKTLFKYVIKNGEKQEGFNVRLNSILYIVHNGLLYTYKEENYTVLLKGKSIRSFSKNYIGTYSGVFDRKLNNINIVGYVNGKIKEFKDETFICYDGLIKLQKDSIHNYINRTNIQTNINNKDLGFARDISKISKNNYLLFTDRAISIINFTDTKAEVVKKTDRNSETFLIYEQIDTLNQSLQRIIVANNNKVEFLNPETLKTYEWVSLDSKITAAIKLNNTKKSNFILASTKNGLYFINSKGEKEKLDDKEYHTLLTYDDENIILSNNYGLFVLNLNTNKITDLVKNIEFNRGALFKEGTKILAGSVNGIVVFDSIANFSNTISLKNKTNTIIITLALILLSISLLIMLKKVKKKKNQPIETTKATKNDIENFIENNLKDVSLSLICEHFNISIRNVYLLLKPNKPGDLIKYRREQKVKKLIKENKYTLSEIAIETGYSLVYLRNNRKKFLGKINKNKKL